MTVRKLFFDLETTGLPEKISFFKYYPYRDLSKYKKSRIVQFSWIITDHDYQNKREYDHIIRPTDFKIPLDSTNIHGITHDHAILNGHHLEHVVDDFVRDLLSVDQIIGHNVNFDLAILRNELYRINRKDVIRLTYQKTIYCTMYNAQKQGLSKRYPKLITLYNDLTGKELEGAHNSLNDVRATIEVHKAMHEQLKLKVKVEEKIINKEIKDKEIKVLPSNIKIKLNLIKK